MINWDSNFTCSQFPLPMRFILTSCFLILLFSIFSLTAQQDSRWHLLPDGGISWTTEKLDSHMDHMEMSGFQISSIIHYGLKAGQLDYNIHLVFPMLRTIPNNTHGSLAHTFDGKDRPKLKADGNDLYEYPQNFYIKGYLEVTSMTKLKIEVKRTFFPSTDQAAFIEKVSVKNLSAKTVEIEIPNIEEDISTEASKGVEGTYVISTSTLPAGRVALSASDSITYAITYAARSLHQRPVFVSSDYEFLKRSQMIDQTFSDLVLETPDKVINSTFDFAKLRAVESIYATRGGLMHGPGGGRYYAAIWANDQAEYANPFFPFLGNLAGNESAINSFRHFARFINDDYRPIPSSIVAEGLDIWNGAGDRGDMAMIAYGASRFCLAYGNRQTAREIWPLITWCLEYCHKKLNKDGVVLSDCDELENRFPAGEANLNTSSLYYDALISAQYLGKALGVASTQIKTYENQARKLEASIEKYFGATVSGYQTYRYYDGNETLRAWICTPLTVGIYNRTAGTIDALFSDDLWTVDGLATEAGKITFWDRATLYALRGVFAAGATNKAMDFLQYYSKRRLLGEHVPYPVEAYPEGNQRHLSAESALYCRVVTEGLFGIRPSGFDSFLLTPRLPDTWNEMALRDIKAFNRSFDLVIRKTTQGLLVDISDPEMVYYHHIVQPGESVLVNLN